MTNLFTVLVARDGLTPEEAKELIAELRARAADGEDPEEILLDELGLEPDYVFDILF